ncbi:hypothetical protein SAMN05192561_105168 [Halopenitus malekzadehii]|uniref:Uncharacterized protein n=1 Tax=Halopenitus malekzadehii TaxID=1267564 RepID=A0A1H6IYJ0_9EURY|nr:hypothetical protein SAMN05192561_105168 [Halopenitus malekzadehii]
MRHLVVADNTIHVSLFYIFKPISWIVYRFHFKVVAFAFEKRRYKIRKALVVFYVEYSYSFADISDQTFLVNIVDVRNSCSLLG